jgi:hypothetical protein
MTTEASLVAHQRTVMAALAPQVTAPDPATAVLRESVRRWARLQLSNVCPLTTMVLGHHGRLVDEVDTQLALGGRPTSIHRWGQDLLARLLDDPDPLVAEMAHLELACVAPQRAAALRPGPWQTTLDPAATVADLLAGRDPRKRSRTDCRLVVQHDERGWHLVTCSGQVDRDLRLRD